MLSVRAATPDDLEALIPLWRELEVVQRPIRYYAMASDAEQRIRRSLAEAIEAGDADVLVVYEAESPVGMALVHVGNPSRMSDERAVELSRVVVRPDRRGSGAGRALVEAAEAWARDRGVLSLVAAIFVANEGSAQFWRAVGFAPWVERMVREVPPELPAED